MTRDLTSIQEDNSDADIDQKYFSYDSHPVVFKFCVKPRIF